MSPSGLLNLGSPNSIFRMGKEALKPFYGMKRILFDKE